MPTVKFKIYIDHPFSGTLCQKIYIWRVYNDLEKHDAMFCGK